MRVRTGAAGARCLRLSREAFLRVFENEEADALESALEQQTNTYGAPASGDDGNV